MSSEPVNTLETKSTRNLKVSLDRVYEMLIEIGYKKSSCEDRLISRDFCKYH
jgi:hypothetical protein